MDDPTAALMPMMTLTVGEDLKEQDQHHSFNGMMGDPDSDQDSSDPNRFNAYLNRGSELWTHWSWLGGQGKMSLMRCNYCHVNKQLKNAPKCRRHLIKCPKTPEPVRRYFEKKEIEATRVSALMRELRSKEIKFPRNSAAHNIDPSNNNIVHKGSSDNHHNTKVPVPTANDLKHLQLKQHTASMNNVIVKQQSNGHGGGSTGSASPADMSLSGSPKFSVKSENHHHHNNHNHHHNTVDIKPVLSSPLTLNGGKSAKHDSNGGGNHALRNDNNNILFNELSMYYQQFLNMQQSASSTSDSSIDLSSKSNHSNGKRSSGGGSNRGDHHSHQLLFDHLNGNGNGPLSSGKLKRKRDSLLSSSGPSSAVQNHRDALSLINHLQSLNNGGGVHLGTTNKENKEQLLNVKLLNGNVNGNGGNGGGSNGGQNNTVVINLDDVNALDESVFFNPLAENGYNHHLPLPPLINANGGGASRKKRPKESVITTTSNGRHDNGNGNHHKAASNGNGYHNRNHSHHHQTDFSSFNPTDLEVVHDDLNDLLASALISAGVDVDFIGNAYFAKFITQLVSVSSGKSNQQNGNYQLPSVEKLLTANLTNLVRKFDHETGKLFSDSDSIVVALDWSASSNVIVSSDHQSSFDVNLLISASNVFSQLFYKTIPSFSQLKIEGDDESSQQVKALLTQVSSLIEKVGADRINAFILPLEQHNITQAEGHSSSASAVITAYLATAHSHIVPLSNSYQLFHRLLEDICRIPSIHKLLAQVTGLFKELATINLPDFQEANENHWKRVFESDSLQIYKHFLKVAGDAKSNLPKNHWVSLNLVLCWFLVAKSSIIELFTKLSEEAEATEGEEESEEEAKAKEDKGLDTLLKKHDLNVNQIERFFLQIHVLFNFLTPFITAVHLIENDSCVISDIVKIYFDVKQTITDGNLFDGVEICDKLERQSLDTLLHRYLQEANLGRYLYLAFYLDPRFRSDKRLEENEELISTVYDTLFSYATALGCVNNSGQEEEDREKLVDSLEEFRNGEKLYGTGLLKSPKSPVKYWKHLQRFPASAKLAYCASRLLSISTRALLLATPTEDDGTASLQKRLMTLGGDSTSADFDPKAGEKLVHIKSYLKLQASEPSSSLPNFDDDEGKSQQLMEASSAAAADLSSTSASALTAGPTSADSISNILSNVITSLEHYSRTIAQPFTGAELARLTQTSCSSASS